MNNLVQIIERELMANHELTCEQFAASIGLSDRRVIRALRNNYGTNWQDLKKRTLQDLPTRANRVMKALISVAENPKAKTVSQAARLIGENPRYVKSLLERSGISWGENFITQTKPVKPDIPVRQARIVVPQHLVMPLRSYQHCKLVYNNTDARV